MWNRIHFVNVKSKPQITESLYSVKLYVACGHTYSWPGCTWMVVSLVLCGRLMLDTLRVDIGGDGVDRSRRRDGPWTYRQIMCADKQQLACLQLSTIRHADQPHSAPQNRRTQSSPCGPHGSCSGCMQCLRRPVFSYSRYNNRIHASRRYFLSFFAIVLCIYTGARKNTSAACYNCSVACRHADDHDV